MLKSFFLAMISLSMVETTFATQLYPSYDVFVYGNFTSSSSDDGGALAAGGTINLTNYTVVNNPLSDTLTTYTLVAGTDLIASGGSVKQGNVYDPIAGGLTNGFTVTSGSVFNPPTGNPINFATVEAGLSARSTQLAGLASNGTVSLVSSTLTLTGSNSSMNVFTVAASQLGGSVTINIVVPNGATAVINVTGTAPATTSAQISFNGHTVNGDATDPSVRNLLWNYYQATTLSLQGGFLGSILAPNAAVTAGNTQFDGQLIAKSFSGGTEFHSFIFNGNLPAATPEPGPLFTTGAGLLSAAFLLKKFRRA